VDTYVAIPSQQMRVAVRRGATTFSNLLRRGERQSASPSSGAHYFIQKPLCRGQWRPLPLPFRTLPHWSSRHIAAASASISNRPPAWSPAKSVSCIKHVHYLQLTTALLQLTGASSPRCSSVWPAIFTAVDLHWLTVGIRLVQQLTEENEAVNW